MTYNCPHCGATHPKPPPVRLDAQLNLRASAPELAAWRAAAAREGLTLSAWLRQYLNAAAGE
jgi:predicted HicB family RNase H-like nuclease